MNDEEKARVIANCEVIVKALREGKEDRLQVKSSYNPNWEPSAGHGFDMHAEYRIKPEPRTIWVNEHIDGRFFVHGSEIAARAVSGPSSGRIAVEYREVVKP